jgi:hypothetical protein
MESCAEPNGRCTPVTCSETNMDSYWMQNTVSNYNQYMSIFYNTFTASAFNTSFDIPSIVKAFPFDSPNNLPADIQLLGNFAAGLSIAGGFLSLGGIDVAEGDIDTGFIAAISSTFGSILAAVGPNIAETVAENDLTAEALLSARLQNVLTALTKGITTAMIQLINQGDISSWPSKVTSNGHYGADLIANFFDNGNFFYTPGDLSFDQTVLAANISQNFQANLAGLALNAANWYILINAYDESDCTSTSLPAAKYINGACYSLESPGTGGRATSLTEYPPTTYSVPMTSNQYTSLTGFNVDVSDLYLSSDSGQSTYNAYDVVGNFTFDNLAFTVDIPACYYNLPVFVVTPASKTSGTVWQSTPCQIVANNATATAKGIGIMYMPANLWAIFDSNRYCCITDVGHGATTTCANGPLG